MEYQWIQISMPITFTEPTVATYSKWVWFWQVGWYRVRGWKVSYRTFLKVKISRGMHLEDYIYGDGADHGKIMGFSALGLKN